MKKTAKVQVYDRNENYYGKSEVDIEVTLNDEGVIKLTIEDEETMLLCHASEIVKVSINGEIYNGHLMNRLRLKNEFPKFDLF